MKQILLALTVSVVSDADTVPTQWVAPVAMWHQCSRDELFVACENSGELVVIDKSRGGVIQRLAAAQRPSDLIGIEDDLIVADRGASCLVQLRSGTAGWRIVRRITVPAEPVNLCRSPEPKQCFVSCRWAREVGVVRLDEEPSYRTLVRLDFSPGHLQLLADQNKLVITDSFAGKVAIWDIGTNRLVRKFEIPGHNIGGLALSPDQTTLLITHLTTYRHAQTNRHDIFWGIVLSSNLRRLPIEALLDSSRDPVQEGMIHFFGDPGLGAGDPGRILTTDNAKVLVCLSGLGHVAVGNYFPNSFRRIATGKRPTAAVSNRDGTLAYVSNWADDSVTILDLTDSTRKGSIALGSGKPRNLAEEGERRFFDASLSLDGWMSCHSCHPHGHTSRQNVDTFGDGSWGSPKNVISLLGTADTRPWAWDGSKEDLISQIESSLANTMRSQQDNQSTHALALAAYLRTLPPIRAPRATGDPQSSVRGEHLFRSLGCKNCHPAPLHTSDFAYNVGLEDEGGRKTFNPPSLRGVGHGAPYFHDGRATNLHQVFQEYRHRLKRELSTRERDDLVNYLKGL